MTSAAARTIPLRGVGACIACGRPAGADCILCGAAICYLAPDCAGCGCWRRALKRKRGLR